MLNKIKTCCRHRILAMMCFPLKMRDSFLYFWKTIFENGLELPLILFFFNGKQNKKENSECDFYYEKAGLRKIEYRSEG